jgi:hypothetical protein
LLAEILDTDQPIGQAFYHYCEQLGRATLSPASEHHRLLGDCREIVQREVRNITPYFQVDHESMLQTQAIVNAMRDWVKQEGLALQENFLYEKDGLRELSNQLNDLYEAMPKNINLGSRYHAEMLFLSNARVFSFGGS